MKTKNEKRRTSKVRKVMAAKAQARKANLVYTHRTLIVAMAVIRRVKVVLKTPRMIGNRILDSYHIHDSMDGNTWFPAPDPTMPDFKNLILKYESAETAVRQGAYDAEAKLKEAWDELEAARLLLRSYVEQICIKNPDHAEAIAMSAGMSVKKAGHRDVQDFVVKSSISGNGCDLSGKVRSARCAHEWQCTLDLNDPMGWYQKLIDTTLQSKTNVTGFSPGDKVYFRHRSILKDGPTEWSEIVSISIPR